jgi:hypothetical protein
MNTRAGSGTFTGVHLCTGVGAHTTGGGRAMIGIGTGVASGTGKG